MSKEVLGHIDCPYCDGVKTVRITNDKNGKPFGHCDDCNGQLRVGGNSFREKKFLQKYPFAAAKAAQIPVTVTEPEKPAAPVPVAPVTVSEPVKKSEPVPEKPAKKKAGWADAVGLLGG